jgi:uncharacterized protein YndB with AHSA1/START domain
MRGGAPEPDGRGAAAGVGSVVVYELTGNLTVDLPPAEALRLFTARGERDWVAGWEPHFPEPTDDDTVPGTVFVTGAHGHQTTWIVLDRVPGRHIRYARATPGVSAGAVAVTLEPAAGGGSEVTVVYTLTALSEAGRHQLADFAAGYHAFLGGWQTAIARFLDGRR